MILFESNFILAFGITLLAFASVVLNLTLILLIFRKTEQANMKVTWLLVITILSLIIWIISVYLQLVFVFPDNNLILFVIVSSTGNVVVLIGLISISNFTKYLVSPTLDTNQFVIMGGTFGVVTGTYIGSVFLALEGESQSVDTLSLIANIFNLFIMIMVIYSVNKNLRILLKENLSDKQSKQVRLVYRSIMVGLIGLIPIILVSVFVDFNLIAIAFVVLPVSFYFINRAYLIDPRVAFILPEKTYLVILVSNTGTLKYSRNYSIEKGAGEDSTVLISGALKAITSLMSEFYAAPVKAKQIEFEEQQILLDWTEYYFLAVFSDQDSTLLRNAMENTISTIEDTYGEELPKAIRSPQMLTLDELFDKTFYFIYS